MVGVGRERWDRFLMRVGGAAPDGTLQCWTMDGARLVGGLLLLLLACFVHTGYSVKCYDCNSAYDPRCDDPFDSYTLADVDCDMKTPLEHLTNVEPTICRKIVQKVYGKVRVIRKCGYIKDGPELPEGKCIQRSGTHDVQVLYCSCEGDHCNVAQTTWKSTSLHIPMVVALTMSWRAISIL